MPEAKTSGWSVVEHDGPKVKLSTVGDGIAAKNARWSFDGISGSFNDHARRSIPFYDEGHDLICRYSDYFVTTSSVVYDIGTTTGLLAHKLADWNKSKPGVRVIGIDIIPSMIDHCQQQYANREDLQFVCADAVTFDYETASLFTCYYVVQFNHPHVRQTLIDHIFKRLHWGGALLMFEKVRGPDARFQDYATQIYTDFKSAHRYSDAEILGKARSLKGVLEPFSTNGNIEMLQRAGFKDIMSVMKWVCFEGFLAIK
jgi:tRNA (cmo5U34)-methyltransferase